MNIEAVIQGNTNAIIGLTEVMMKLMKALEPMSVKEPIKTIEEPIRTIEESLKVSKADYPTVKALIGSLALNHRDDIKALNTKYELAVFADILIDKNDVTKGVKDEDKLEHYYEDLLKLK